MVVGMMVVLFVGLVLLLGIVFLKVNLFESGWAMGLLNYTSVKVI
jgi:hypothetical protein